MRISTIEELSDQLDRDLSWRKKEIATVALLIERLQFEEQRVVLRGSFAILYAHWEGFVKESFFFYMNYIQNLGLTASDLNDSVVAYCQRTSLKAFELQGLGVGHIEIIKKLRSKETGQLKFHRTSREIDVNGNLSSKKFLVLMEYASVKFDKDTQDTFSLIDNDLLKDRNAISHGGDDEIDLDTWRTVRERVISFLDQVSGEMLTSALDERHIRKS